MNVIECLSREIPIALETYLPIDFLKDRERKIYELSLVVFSALSLLLTVVLYLVRKYRISKRE